MFRQHRVRQKAALEVPNRHLEASTREVEEQQQAYQVAFRRVLLNNSGDKTLLNRDDIRDGLKRAEQYVSGFSYRTPPPGTVIE